MADRRPLVAALARAVELIEMLRPGCTRIEVAGSIRREAPTVKDIELVCVPAHRVDLLGDPSEDLLNATVRDLVAARRLQWRVPGGLVGSPEPTDLRDRRYYALATVEDEPWPIDLFCVRPPAQWGAIFAIRTGPWEFSQRLVTAAHLRMLKCHEGRLVSTALANCGDDVATPEERDFFAAVGVPFVEPRRRQAVR